MEFKIPEQSSDLLEANLEKKSRVT